MKWVRPAVLFTAIVNGCATLCHLLFYSLHAQGRMQGTLDYVNAFVDLVRTPGHLATRIHGLTSAPLGLLSGESIILAADLVTYAVAGAVLAAAWAWLRGGTSPADLADPANEPDDLSQAAALSPSRRMFLRASGGMVAGAAAASFGYSFVLEPRHPLITHHTLPIRDLPPELDGLRLVHLTDVHHGPWLSLDRVHEVIDLANAQKPDLIVLTGDYVHRLSAYLRPVAEALAELKPTIGRVGVLGNHEWWEGGRDPAGELRRCGIRMIDNTRLILTRDRTLATGAAEGLCVAGIGDLLSDRQDYNAALGSLPQEMPRLLLSHNPDSAEEMDLVAGGYRVDLMLCGHTHGGQVWVPGLGTPIVPSRFGSKYASGLVQGPVCRVFISRGTGTALLPLRFGVPPEIPVIELKRQA